MGWRSWNPYGVDVDQQKMERVVAAMVERKRTVNGKPTSLLDLGYLNVGLDGGWEQCASVKYRLRYHDSNGRPIINSKFPSLKDLVEYGHQNGLHMGWYHNVCECPEMQLRKGAEELGVYHGDADAILQAGFDSVKFDGCGQLNNMTLWAQLLNASTRPVMIENCHWGYCDGEDFQSPRRFDRDDSSCPQRKSDGSIHCPFHFFRTSMDINTDSETWIRNLQTAVRFLDRDKPLAGKGCWAYPDMLEVGYLKTFEWNRAHFGAWAIMSAPLVLGLDLLNSPLVDSVWEIISNQEAIQVNQRWAGHPGWLLKSWTPDGARKSNNWPNTPNGGVKYEAPLDAMQAWVKPQPGGAVAILVINADASSAKGLDFAIQLSEIGITDGRTATIRSIWDHTNLGIATGEVKGRVGPQDSVFLLLSQLPLPPNPPLPSPPPSPSPPPVPCPPPPTIWPPPPFPAPPPTLPPPAPPDPPLPPPPLLPLPMPERIAKVLTPVRLALGSVFFLAACVWIAACTQPVRKPRRDGHRRAPTNGRGHAQDRGHPGKSRTKGKTRSCNLKTAKATPSELAPIASAAMD